MMAASAKRRATTYVSAAADPQLRRGSQREGQRRARVHGITVGQVAVQHLPASEDVEVVVIQEAADVTVRIVEAEQPRPEEERNGNNHDPNSTAARLTIGAESPAAIDERRIPAN